MIDGICARRWPGARQFKLVDLRLKPRKVGGIPVGVVSTQAFADLCEGMVDPSMKMMRVLDRRLGVRDPLATVRAVGYVGSRLVHVARGTAPGSSAALVPELVKFDELVAETVGSAVRVGVGTRRSSGLTDPDCHSSHLLRIPFRVGGLGFRSTRDVHGVASAALTALHFGDDLVSDHGRQLAFGGVSHLSDVSEEHFFEMLQRPSPSLQKVLTKTIVDRHHMEAADRLLANEGVAGFRITMSKTRAQVTSCHSLGEMCAMSAALLIQFRLGMTENESLGGQCGVASCKAVLPQHCDQEGNLVRVLRGLDVHAVTCSAARRSVGGKCGKGAFSQYAVHNYLRDVTRTILLKCGYAGVPESGEEYVEKTTTRADLVYRRVDGTKVYIDATISAAPGYSKEDVFACEKLCVKRKRTSYGKVFSTCEQQLTVDKHLVVVSCTSLGVLTSSTFDFFKRLVREAVDLEPGFNLFGALKGYHLRVAQTNVRVLSATLSVPIFSGKRKR